MGGKVSDTPQIVLDLVDRYAREQKVLQSNAYGEADTRKEFLEPLFTALGWDVANKSLYAEAYKDVVNEYSLKIGATHKAPDYAFRVGGIRKFFVEAKRPGIDLSTDIEPAYQLRRYGWTAKLPVSVLTNFRYTAVYDCTKRPSETDRASAARTLIIAWSDLDKSWDQLKSLLGKEDVYRGSLDRYAAGVTRLRGTALVDDEFLKQMEDWRSDLARNIALRNKSLSVPELNEAVQQTIDRLIFLRIAEDRGIEFYGTLQEQLAKTGVYAHLLNVFHSADLRYNSGLFHFRKDAQVSGAPDLLTPKLQIDDGVLRSVINTMYYPTSPYEFSVFPADILGQVYEQFLGKVIRLTPSHEARIEDKPEVNRAGGVYYTPTNIVDDIVGKTLSKVLEGKSPRAALNIRILDPACGSGSFLIGAYEYLTRWFTAAYVSEGPEKHSRALYNAPNGEWHLTLAERKRILTSCIYGVDIDRQAVEVTKLSLMLKVLEDESNETINSQQKMFDVQRVLPDLNRNVQCGNSLVGYDVLDDLILTPTEEDSLNPFDWEISFPAIMKTGGFHVVIGNPPYDVLEKDRGKVSWPHGLLRDYLPYRPDYLPALGHKLNLYRLFIVRALSLTRPRGQFGMIVPLSLAADISTAATRRHVFTSLANLSLDCFPQKDNPARRIFKRAKLSTVVVTGMKSVKPLDGSNVITTRVFPGNDLNEAAIENSLTVAECALLDPETSPVPLTDSAEWELCKRIYNDHRTQRLGELADSYDVTRGEINQTTYRAYIKQTATDNKDLLKGVEVNAFETNATLSQGEREWLDQKHLITDHPNKKLPPSIRIATQRITGVDERQRLVAAVIKSGAWFADSTNSIAPADGAPLSLEYLVALLNSDLMQWRFRLTSTNNNVGTNELLMLPICVPDWKSDADRTNYFEACRTAQRISVLKSDLSGSRSPGARDTLARRIEAASAKLETTVAALYGLAEEDRQLIAARLTRKPIAADANVAEEDLGVVESAG